jgi:mono/diheme cytochrome c family protein
MGREAVDSADSSGGTTDEEGVRSVQRATGLTAYAGRDPHLGPPPFRARKEFAARLTQTRRDVRPASLVCSFPLKGGGLGWGSTVAALALLSALVAAMPTCAAEPTDAEIDQGREVYGELCVSCHGRDMINPGGVTFDLRKFPKDDFERFRSSVLNGKPPAMPPWRDKVGDEDIRLLWAYVRSGG